MGQKSIQDAHKEPLDWREQQVQQWNLREILGFHSWIASSSIQWENARLHGKADSIVDDLFWCVWVLGDCLDLLTLLNSVQEHFWGFCGREWTAELCIVLES
jgi:hypothetical protein